MRFFTAYLMIIYVAFICIHAITRIEWYWYESLQLGDFCKYLRGGGGEGEMFSHNYDVTTDCVCLLVFANCVSAFQFSKYTTQQNTVQKNRMKITR